MKPVRGPKSRKETSSGRGQAAYPKHRIADVPLMDGSTIRVRPVLPSDADAVFDLFSRLSEEALHLRFLGSRRISRKESEEFVRADYRTRSGILAERKIAGQMSVVALATYVKIARGKAEVAIAVDDLFHGIGLGSLLVEHLAEAAEEAGIHTFEADILGENYGMLELIRHSELSARSRVTSGVVHIEFPTSPTPDALQAFEHREATAAAASLRLFLEPRSVAVIGASRRLGSIGGELFRNLVSSGFSGSVYPVNEKADAVQSIPAYPSIRDVPAPVDMAVLVVPAHSVLEVAEECGEAGVRALLVISSGFSEIGAEGSEMQDRLLEIARAYGMRIIGPNCMGLINPDPDISLNATFSPSWPSPGNLAFSSQSGALGIAIIDAVNAMGLGMSSFVSVGNKVDISGNDLLQYWEQDPRTDVILLYLESFGNPQKFARIARRVSRTKPIIAVKSGRSQAGARAAASHTGSLAAGDVAVDALFHQAGVIRTDTLEEMFDVASLLANQPLPRGPRVGIITNAGGLGILAADACEASGLEVAKLSARTQRQLEACLPAEASVNNPVDMIASASADQYAKTLEVLADDPGVDSLIVIFIPPLVTKAEDVAAALLEASDKTAKTMAACFMGGHGIQDRLRSGDRVIPSYAFPESASRALARAAMYASWRDRPEGSSRPFDDMNIRHARALASKAIAKHETWLPPDEVGELLTAYGLALVRSGSAKTPQEVRHLAEDLGFPVAVKVDSPDVIHKSDIGGVVLDLDSADSAVEAARHIAERAEARGLAINGFVVQEMVKASGAELFVGVTHDPLFGPLIACGAGGTMVELIRDVAVRITPLTDVDAGEMIRSLKTFPMLEGFRGSPPLDVEAVEELLLRVSALVESLPQLRELDLNPVLVRSRGDGYVILDARVHLERSLPAAPRGARLRAGVRPRIDP